jgi:large subunit ribosomal protein L44e
MKIKREKRTHCRTCRKHTVHEVLRVKKRKASELKAGQRQFRRVLSGYGGFPRALPSGAKPTKKISLLLKCKICKKSHNMIGFRSKKFEIVET